MGLTRNSHACSTALAQAMPQDLRVFGVTPEMEKAGQSAWRMLSRLPGVLARMGTEAKPHWTNLAALKQTVGATLRAPGRDLISRRVANIAADAKESHFAPFKARGDSAWLAELDRMHAPSTHEKLFLRHGQPVPAADGRLFRGTVGGDPWGGGSFGGAFHYAAPDKATASLYGRLHTPFLKPEKQIARTKLYSADTMEAIQHYGSAPGQKVWRPWGPEDAITGTASNRARNASQNYSQMLGNAETTVMPRHNPFLGTELRVSGFDRNPLWLSEQHGYFPAGRASRAAQNYRNQTAQSVRWTQGGPAATQFEQVANLNTTPWIESIRRNPRMMRMQAENPAALRELMSRRADRILGPDPALMFKSGSTIERLGGIAAPMEKEAIFGSIGRGVSRGISRGLSNVAVKTGLKPSVREMLKVRRGLNVTKDTGVEGMHIPMNGAKGFKPGRVAVLEDGDLGAYYPRRKQIRLAAESGRDTLRHELAHAYQDRGSGPLQRMMNWATESNRPTLKRSFGDAMIEAQARMVEHRGVLKGLRAWGEDAELYLDGARGVAALPYYVSRMVGNNMGAGGLGRIGAATVGAIGLDRMGINMGVLGRGRNVNRRSAPTPPTPPTAGGSAPTPGVSAPPPTAGVSAPTPPTYAATGASRMATLGGVDDAPGEHNFWDKSATL